MTETLRDEAIAKVDETPPGETVCSLCGIVTARCTGDCCEGCDCL